MPAQTDEHRSITVRVFFLIIGLLFWLYIILGVVWNLLPASRPVFVNWWWLIAAAIALCVLIPILIAILGWVKHSTTGSRTGAFVFVVIPGLLMGIGAIVLFSNQTKIIVLRSVFLFAVCLFPALIYYCFIATRKIGFLSDYFLNLGRLGLLKPRSTPAAAHDVKVRLLNYIQRFEALYGPVQASLKESILTTHDPLEGLANPTLREAALAGIAEVFPAEAAIPVVLATILIALGWLLALPPTGIEISDDSMLWSTAFKINEDPIIYAFLGAYFFSLQMLFRRYVREDLRRSAYIAVSLRIILAVIGTWAAITAIRAVWQVNSNSTISQLQASYLPIVGFIIGFFPGVVWQCIQGATAKFGHFVLPSMQSRLPLSDLEGLTTWHESRLEEEDIENIPNMASADIVDLMISTRISPDRIVDWVDQSILFTHLGPKQDAVDGRTENLRLQGIYTATSLIQAFARAQSFSREDALKVEEILSAASRSNIRSLIDAMITEPNLELICAWRGVALTERQGTTTSAPLPGQTIAGSVPTELALVPPTKYIKYFAYGSNMLEQWLQSTDRVPDAKFLAVGYVTKRRLCFRKRSKDESAKCDIAESGSASDVVHGVVFEVPENQIKYLDQAEGVGGGYIRTEIEVLRDSASTISAAVYLAHKDYLTSELVPYTWYRDLVVAGARQHSLPPSYIEKIVRDTVNAKIQDPPTDESERAVQALSRAGYDPDAVSPVAEFKHSA